SPCVVHPVEGVVEMQVVGFERAATVDADAGQRVLDGEAFSNCYSHVGACRMQGDELAVAVDLDEGVVGEANDRDRFADDRQAAKELDRLRKAVELGTEVNDIIGRGRIDNIDRVPQ